MVDDTNTLYVRRFRKKSLDLGHGYSVKMVASGRYYAFLSGRIIGGATETFDGAILLAQGHFDMLRDEVGADCGDDMTDMIPRDAAIRAVNLAIWKSPIKAQISTIDASNDTAEALRAIPTIDPASIREAALYELAEIARGDGPLDEEAILALIGEKK